MNHRQAVGKPDIPNAQKGITIVWKWPKFMPYSPYQNTLIDAVFGAVVFFLWPYLTINASSRFSMGNNVTHDSRFHPLSCEVPLNVMSYSLDVYEPRRQSFVSCLPRPLQKGIKGQNGYCLLHFSGLDFYRLAFLGLDWGAAIPGISPASAKERRFWTLEKLAWVLCCCGHSVIVDKFRRRRPRYSWYQQQDSDQLGTSYRSR